MRKWLNKSPIYKYIIFISLKWEKSFLKKLLYIGKEDSSLLRERERERERGRERGGTASIYNISSGWHQVEIHIQRALILRASFTGGWYRAALQPESQLDPLRLSVCFCLLSLRVPPDRPLRSKTSVIVYFSDAHTFFFGTPPTQFFWRN